MQLSTCTVAHEIAHFILGYNALVDTGAENAADDLIEKWGFKRVYENHQNYQEV